LKQCFSDIFIFYRPRDTVSGDFYWFDKRNDGSLYFVAADCTGHGIPGAFMSMMGIDGFNYAILERNIQRPAAILTHVNQFIKGSLRQENDSAPNKDGMDASLIWINPEKTKMIYAGANRSIYVIRNLQLLELKPDKLSIGGNHLSNFEFSEQEIKIEKNDLVYLSTDGYADQFGGPNGKKFMTKRLKDLLIEIHLRPIEEQMAIIDSTFQNWKGSFEQVDDVLLVGIKI
jgi:serine phosphatase RsbU (regulator of sigma subunit)